MVNITYIAPGNDVSYTQANGTEAVYNLGDMAWILTSMALVWLMIPGVGLLYSGLLRRKNGLSMLVIMLGGIAVGSFQWFFWGYSLAFSSTASKFIGNLDNFALKGVLEAPSIGSSRIPALLFCIYQCMFAVITAVLATAGFAERSRIGPVFPFIFCWLTLVYCPVACWTWNTNGWTYLLGGLDFAGGTPVHITSGSASLAIALYLGKRRGYGTEKLAYKPHNTMSIILGTVFLWFGWFGFNGGSALGANLRAVMACVVTNLAASCGALAWMALDWRLERKWSAVGACSGAIAGLVGITPASGFVGAPASVAIGVVTAVACNFATRLKFLIHVDEALDGFALHAIGGMTGCWLTALFAQASVAGLDGTPIPGGWFDHHWIQLPYQMADSVAGMSYAFVMTTIICWIFHFIPGFRLRCSEEAEIIGIDDAECGEFLADYIALDTELRVTHTPSEMSDEHRDLAKDGPIGNEKAGGGRIDP